MLLFVLVVGYTGVLTKVMPARLGRSCLSLRQELPLLPHTHTSLKPHMRQSFAILLTILNALTFTGVD